MPVYQRVIASPLGPLRLTASDRGLQRLDRIAANSKLHQGAKHAILDQAELELNQYFEGRRQHFSVPLDLVGTPFQQSVWKSLTQIPYGKTWSYKELAAAVKKPKASRAVGGANGKNPVCIIVPCHRVIAADGSIGGYSGGLGMKKKLLALEGLDYSTM